MSKISLRGLLIDDLEENPESMIKNESIQDENRGQSVKNEESSQNDDMNLSIKD